MEQTAVEWLLNEFQEVHKDFGGLDTNWLKRFEQAKEMEKEQITQSFNHGRNVGRSGSPGVDGNYYYETIFKEE